MLNMVLVLLSFDVFFILAPVFPGRSVEIPSLLWAQQSPKTETEKYAEYYVKILDEPL